MRNPSRDLAAGSPNVARIGQGRNRCAETRASGDPSAAARPVHLSAYKSRHPAFTTVWSCVLSAFGAPNAFATCGLVRYKRNPRSTATTKTCQASTPTRGSGSERRVGRLGPTVSTAHGAFRRISATEPRSIFFRPWRPCVPRTIRPIWLCSMVDSRIGHSLGVRDGGGCRVGKIGCEEEVLNLNSGWHFQDFHLAPPLTRILTP